MAEETVQLARYAAALRYEDLPPAVVAAAKDCIIDTVAACICGARLPWSRIVIDYAERTGPGGASRILGRGTAVQAPAAALANGALGACLRARRLTRPGAGAHPGATVLPPALAVAQQRGSTRPARTLIAAFVAGNEVMIRIGRATGHTNEARGFHAPGTTGPFGAAVACGRCSASTSGEDDQRDRHRRLARRRPARIRQGRRRHGQAAASRPRLGGRGAGGEPGGMAGSTAPRTVIEGEFGFLRVFCTEWDESRSDPRPRQRLRDAERGVEALPVPRDRACRGQGGARPAGGARFAGGDVAAITVTGTPPHGRAPQHPRAARSDAGAVFDPVLRRAGALPRGARPGELRRERARRPGDPRADPQVRLVPEEGGGHGAAGSDVTIDARRRPAFRGHETSGMLEPGELDDKFARLSRGVIGARSQPSTSDCSVSKASPASIGSARDFTQMRHPGAGRDPPIRRCSG